MNSRIFGSRPNYKDSEGRVKLKFVPGTDEVLAK
jgi:hypothetical protein